MQSSSETKVFILTPSDEPAWQVYVNLHPDATIYHTLEWRDILYNEYRFEPVYLMAKDGERVAGIFPMCLLKNLRGRRLVSLPFSIYGGPLAETDSVTEVLLSKSVDIVKERKAGYVGIKPAGRIDCAERLGFKTLEWGAGTVMDLGVGRDALWAAFEERYNVKKGEKKGIRFVLSEGERLDDFYRLQLMTRKRLGLPTPSLRYYSSFFERMPGMVKLAIVEKDGNAIAGDIFFTYKESVLLALNVSDHRYMNCKPNDFMIWNIIEWACEAGFKTLDHGPVSLEKKGLLHFKEKWGGGTFNVFRYYYPSAVRGATDAKGSLLFRAMPVKMAGMIGARVIKTFG